VKYFLRYLFFANFILTIIVVRTIPANIFALLFPADNPHNRKYNGYDNPAKHDIVK